MMESQNPAANVGHPSILLSTTDIDKTYSELKDNGVELGKLMEMPYGRMFSFNDNEGNAYLIREDK